MKTKRKLQRKISTHSIKSFKELLNLADTEHISVKASRKKLSVRFK